MGESLVYSWLRHIKECQIVQMNWKVSDRWASTITDDLIDLMEKIDKKFDLPFGKTKDLKSLIKQSEVDAIGFNFNTNTVYGVDVAFHKGGLGYSDNVKNVTKKIFRTLLTLDVYFDNSFNKEVIFTTPKINPNEYNKLAERINEINKFIEDENLDTTILFISNNKFESDILNPIFHLSNDVSDTSELFLRSYQLTQLFKPNEVKYTDSDIKNKPIQNTNKEEKIGKFVRNTFKMLFEENKLSDEEIKKLTDKEYSRATFDVYHPVLVRIDFEKDVNSQRKVNGSDRYYSSPYEEKYLLCNDWYERNRQFFNKWLLKIDCNLTISI